MMHRVHATYLEGTVKKTKVIYEGGSIMEGFCAERDFIKQHFDCFLYTNWFSMKDHHELAKKTRIVAGRYYKGMAYDKHPVREDIWYPALIDGVKKSDLTCAEDYDSLMF